MEEEKYRPTRMEYFVGVILGVACYAFISCCFDIGPDKRVICGGASLLLFQAVAHQMAKSRIRRIQNQRHLAYDMHRPGKRLPRK